MSRVYAWAKAVQGIVEDGGRLAADVVHLDLVAAGLGH